MSLTTLTYSGRAGMAQALAAMPLHFAWGSGEQSWDEDPDQNHLKQSLVHAIALNNEVGRRAVTAKGYVVPDEDGEITIPVGRHSELLHCIIRAAKTQIYERKMRRPPAQTRELLWQAERGAGVFEIAGAQGVQPAAYQRERL